jgi:hypothetical protein
VAITFAFTALIPLRFFVVETLAITAPPLEPPPVNCSKRCRCISMRDNAMDVDMDMDLVVDCEADDDAEADGDGGGGGVVVAVRILI